MDNNINNFDKDIVSTTTSGNFFYDDYGIKHFITLNRLILIKTAKNIVTSINNNAFIYGLTSSIESSSIKPSITGPPTSDSISIYPRLDAMKPLHKLRL